MKVSVSYPTLDIWKKHFGDSFTPDAANIGSGVGVFRSNPPKSAKVSKHSANNLKSHPILGSLFGDFSVAGADLSIMLKNPEVHPSKGVLVILAQDPLRSKKDYSTYSATLGKDIIVSLPFGLQADLKNSGCVVVANVIEELLNDGWKVFVTDINKFHVKDNNDNPIAINAQQQKLFDQVLKEELEAVDATHVLLMGNAAKKADERISMSYNIIAVPHPSGAANRAWKKLQGVADKTSKIEHILNEIQKKSWLTQG